MLGRFREIGDVDKRKRELGTLGGAFGGAPSPAPRAATKCRGNGVESLVAIRRAGDRHDQADCGQRADDQDGEHDADRKRREAAPL